MNAFDRNLACGPWRLLPVPAHLADARLADGLPHLFSGAMAGLAGLSFLWMLGGIGQVPPVSLADLAPVVLVGGSWLGSGRASVAGTFLAGLGLLGLRYWLILSRVEMKLADLVVPAVALISPVASAVVHAVAARAHARRREREEIAQGVAGAAS